MKKRTRNILIFVLIAVILFGTSLFAWRVCPLLDGDDVISWIRVDDNRGDAAGSVELTDGETDILQLKLASVKMRWSGGSVHSFQTENVQFYVDYIVDGVPWHLVLGEPCFAYESSGGPKYLIIQDDDYERLMDELRDMAG